ncbi:hypothetical protein EV385_1850 [Krasilnikovia cinnamomea]|uniref:Uncharacterized protein n=1 Tax=Krasilnikovia cinnamomea TaxID=349313 RepID=A0A4Q7ZH30_9ACTN|nr:DUF6578 domain-containing protein [Krasilnikovia cinnamomea]RZU50087.1 hypothetical protein EV385_1850 [Krasilnikovia cinnamomea]
MELNVWVDGWQMQCCGEPFSVGSDVSWTLRWEPDWEWLSVLLGDQGAASMDAAEDHHEDVPEGTPETVGTVRSITAVHCRYAPSGAPRELVPVPGSGVLTPLSKADGWTKDRDELRFVGYLVRIATDAQPPDPARPALG